MLIHPSNKTKPEKNRNYKGKKKIKTPHFNPRRNYFEKLFYIAPIDSQLVGYF